MNATTLTHSAPLAAADLEAAQALAYQETLTKAGTPRVRA